MKTPVILLTLCILGSAFAQDVPPPPKPADNGPTLAATMQFIQEQLGSIGPVNYVAYFHNNTTGNDITSKFTFEVTNVRASVDGCRINYHARQTREGDATLERDGGILLKDVTEVVVKTMDRELKEGNQKAGQSEWNSKVDPPVYVVQTAPIAYGNQFRLYDESLANRLAKALMHAVEVCGGGSKDPL